MGVDSGMDATSLFDCLLQAPCEEFLGELFSNNFYSQKTFYLYKTKHGRFLWLSKKNNPKDYLGFELKLTYCKNWTNHKDKKFTLYSVSLFKVNEEDLWE